MKKKFLTLCAIVSISAMSIACGDTASEAETPDTEVTSEVADADTQTDAAEAEVSEEVEEAEDASSAEGSDEEGKYVVFHDPAKGLLRIPLADINCSNVSSGAGWVGYSKVG